MPDTRRMAAAVITGAALCLATAGCSAVNSTAGGGVPAQSPQASAAAAGTPGTSLSLGGMPAASAFASGVTKVVPPSPLGPPADPFAGTPADPWADGAAGIVAPAARAVGPYTRQQVKYAYKMTIKLLIAANLNKQTLLGGAPAAFESLLIPPERTSFLHDLDHAGFDKHGSPRSSRTWVMSFSPGSTKLIGSVIKVHGSMHAKVLRNSNGTEELDVRADYLFVYPVEPPHQPGNWMRVVSEDQWDVLFTDWPGAATAFAPWVRPSGIVSGIDCGIADGYQHPAYPVQAATQPTASPSGTAVDPYVMGQSETGPCHPITGT